MFAHAPPRQTPLQQLAFAAHGCPTATQARQKPPTQLPLQHVALDWQLPAISVQVQIDDVQLPLQQARLAQFCCFNAHGAPPELEVVEPVPAPVVPPPEPLQATAKRAIETLAGLIATYRCNALRHAALTPASVSAKRTTQSSI